MTTQQHATLRNNGVTSWLNKNNISIEAQLDLHADANKQLPPEIQPKSNRTITDTKQSIIAPLYSHSHSHSRSISDSQASFVTNHSDVTASINYKKLPAKMPKNHISKYRESMSRDSTKIHSLQLITPRSYSNTPSRDRALCGSLIQQTRRHQFNKYNNPYQLRHSRTPNIHQAAHTATAIYNSHTQNILYNKNTIANKNKVKQTSKHRYNKSYKTKDKTLDLTTFCLEDWLLSMDILEYRHIFSAEGFDKLGAIVELTGDDLREMNIPKGHCKMILRQVHNLQIELNIKPINKHQKQSYSDPIIPSIHKILSGSMDDDDDDDYYSDEEDDKLSTHKSCGFPDIDSSVIDINKIHAHTNKSQEMIEHSIDSIGFHTFPRTSTNTSPFPLNVTIKNNNKALQALTVNIPSISSHNHSKNNKNDNKRFNYRRRPYETAQKNKNKNRLQGRVYKNKKNKKKSTHYQSKSSPLMNISTDKLLTKSKKCVKNKKEQHTNRIHWFLCGSSKNAQQKNEKNIDIEVKHHEIKTEVENDTITPEFIPTHLKKQEENIALSISAEELDLNSPSVDEYYEREAKETLNVAKELHRIGNIAHAAEKYAEFLHYFRNDVDARIRYALCLLDLEEYSLCKAQLDLLIRCDEHNLNNNMLQFVYGLLQHKCNNFNDAIKHYNAALLNGYIYKDRIYNNLASLFRSCKDYINAEKYQLLAVQSNNTNYISYINYAKILTDIGFNRFNEATKAYQNAIALRPDLTHIHVEFALFLMDIKQDYLMAATQLNTAHKLSPNNQEINQLLAQAIQYCADEHSDDSDDYSCPSASSSGDDNDNDNDKEGLLDNPHNPTNPRRENFIVNDDDAGSVLSDLSDI